MSPRTKISVGLADGTDGVLATVYRQHWQALCRHVRINFGAGPPEPEDIAQAAFTKLAAIENPSSIENPGAFLRRVARNIAIDAHRRNGRTRRVEQSLEIFEAENTELSPEDVLVSKDELKRLNDVIANLKPKHRVALMLRRMDGLTFIQIAREMGISEAGARVLVAAALDQCAAAMAEDR
jgi:RNA polymerase sigma factor (sigma-70 family)